MIIRDPGFFSLFALTSLTYGFPSGSKKAAAAPAIMLTFQPAKRSKEKNRMPLPFKDTFWKVPYNISTYISLISTVT